MVAGRVDDVLKLVYFRLRQVDIDPLKDDVRFWVEDQRVHGEQTGIYLL